MVNHNWVNGNRSTPTRFNDSAEQKLWRAVLGAAVVDAVEEAVLDCNGNYKLPVQTSMDREYFTNPTRSFYQVCQYAGYDPEYIQRKIRKALDDRKKQGYLSPLQR